MNEPRRTIESLMASIDPPPAEPQDAMVAPRVHRLGRVAVVVLALALLTGSATLLVTAFGHRATHLTAFPAKPRAGQVCSRPSPPDSYTPQISPQSGPAGSTFTISGFVPSYSEDGSYSGPSGSIAFWWNVNADDVADALPWSNGGSPNPPPALPGPSLLLGTTDVTGLCTYSVSFIVPQGATPGSYPITPVAADGDSASLLGPGSFTFTVTS